MTFAAALRGIFPYTAMREVSFLEQALPFGRELVKIVPVHSGFEVSAGEQTHYAPTAQGALEHALRLVARSQSNED